MLLPIPLCYCLYTFATINVCSHLLLFFVCYIPLSPAWSALSSLVVHSYWHSLPTLVWSRSHLCLLSFLTCTCCLLLPGLLLLPAPIPCCCCFSFYVHLCPLSPLLIVHSHLCTLCALLCHLPLSMSHCSLSFAPFAPSFTCVPCLKQFMHVIYVSIMQTCTIPLICQLNHCYLDHYWCVPTDRPLVLRDETKNWHLTKCSWVLSRLCMLLLSSPDGQCCQGQSQ